MDETPEIPDLRSIVLPTKPDCPIKYTFTTLGTSDGSPSEAILIVFVNGLGLPQSSWQPTLQLLRTDLASSVGGGEGKHVVAAATYDRYGQGLSQPLPSGAAEPVPHDMPDAVADLSAFIDGLKSQHLAHFVFRRKPVRLFLVAHSLGVPLARLFAGRHRQHYPLAALLALDSNMANNDFVSLFPDPGTAEFDPERDLPADTTLEQLRSARAFARAMFHPAAPNAENLDRSTLPTLLPRSDGPVLSGDSRVGNGGKLLLRVAGHDPKSFAEESLKVWPRGLTERYVQPGWEKYNEGLLGIAGDGPGTRGEVVIAPQCGHFIQKNNPRFVADEIIGLLKRLYGGES
ncbi:acyl-CoA N-acyltransferase [Apiospora arundinis]